MMSHVRKPPPGDRLPALEWKATKTAIGRNRRAGAVAAERLLARRRDRGHQGRACDAVAHEDVVSLKSSPATRSRAFELKAT